MNLWLVGMMGSGKSTVGSMLAPDLGLEFVDTDAAIESRIEVSISTFWESEGEKGFRALEKEEIVRASKLAAVVSTGGGAPLLAANRATMASTGRILWLRASLKVLASRLEHMSDRPLLDDPLDQALARLIAEREPVYRSVADMIVNTDHLTPLEVARISADWWSS